MSMPCLIVWRMSHLILCHEVGHTRPWDNSAKEKLDISVVGAVDVALALIQTSNSDL